MRNLLEQDRVTERGAEPAEYDNGAWLRSAIFWSSAAALTLAFYWICLRFLYPAYFAPLSPFHVDFYDYAAAREKSFLLLIQYFPRPVSYIGFKILASRGLNVMMAGGIAVALIDVLLTMALVRRMLQLYTPWLLASYAVYLLLLFSHPEFYIEHRHDLPAELSWFFLAISLLAWMSWVEKRRFGILAAAIACAVLFAFAKEAYFLSALILVLGMAVTDRAHWRKHAAFMVFLLLIESASFAWTSHFNGPFVNLNADPSATYHISLAPASMAATYQYYLSYLLNPWLIAIAVLGLIAAGYRRNRFIPMLAFILAAFAVFATLAVLPNHKFGEYAWSAAPLFLVPVLPLCKPGFSLPWRIAQVALLAILSVFAVAGSGGYRGDYTASGFQWWAQEDQKTYAIWSSVERLQAIPRPARVLISGLDDANLPWEVHDFVEREFGDRIHWTIAFPPDVQYRRSSDLVTFANAADVRLSNFDYLATYHANGHLAAVKPVRTISDSDDPAEVMLPDLKDWLAAERAAPGNYGNPLEGAKLCMSWGFLSEAGHLLDRTRADGGGSDGWYLRLSSDLKKQEELVSGPAVPTEFTANPTHIVQPDHSGLGVTTLVWNAPGKASVEIHVNSPGGPLLASGGSAGKALTQKWVTNGMRFFLQDVTGGKPLTPENTLAAVKVEVTP